MVREMMEFLPSAKVGLKTYLRDDLQISPAFRSKVHGFKSHKMTSSDNQQLQWPDFRIFTILSLKHWILDLQMSDTSQTRQTCQTPGKSPNYMASKLKKIHDFWRPIHHPPAALPTKAPLIGVHRATHHGLAQAIGRGHKDHVFEAALRV